MDGDANTELKVQNYSQIHTSVATPGGQFQRVTRVTFDVVRDGINVAHYTKDFIVGRDETATVTGDMQTYIAELRKRLQAAAAL